MIGNDESIVQMANALGPAGEGDDGFAGEHVIQQLHRMAGTFRPRNDRHIGEGEITRQVRQRVRSDPDDRTRDPEFLGELFVFLLRESSETSGLTINKRASGCACRATAKARSK